MTPSHSAWLGLLARRVFQAAALASLVGTLCFFMARALPGDLAMRIAAGRYGYDLVGNAAAEAVRAELGLDRPVWRALVQWWTQLVRLDLGTSLVTGVPVWQEVAHQFGLPGDADTAGNLIAAVEYVLQSNSDNVHMVVCIYSAGNAKA